MIILTAITLPFMTREPISLPPIVSVELIQITDKTNIPFAPKARKIIDKVKDAFNPEFINRLDDCIVYHTLSQEKVIDIIDIQLEDLTENLKELNLSLVVSKKAKRLLAKNGFSLEYGVRFLRREIQNSIENPLSELLLAGKQFKDVAGVKIDVKNNMFIFEAINFKRKKITNKSQIPST